MWCTLLIRMCSKNKQKIDSFSRELRTGRTAAAVNNLQITYKQAAGASHSHIQANSPMPLKITWKSGTTGRSTKESCWLTRASLTILYPEINTILSLPLLRLNTGPYSWASWSHSHTKMELTLTLRVFFCLCSSQTK